MTLRYSMLWRLGIAMAGGIQNMTTSATICEAGLLNYSTHRQGITAD
jgi:hypothetical protein